MRTKALLLGSALMAGSVLCGLAQTVYSINAVGYVNLTIPTGFSIIGNPLNTTNNTVETLFAAPPMGTTIYKWDGASFQTAQYFGVWLNGSITLNPGEGAWINTSTAFTNTFVGEVMQGNLTNTIPVGFSIQASPVPQQDTVDNLNLTASLAAGNVGQATMYQWVNDGNGSGTYQTAVYFNGVGWLGGAPTVKVGEGFWLNSDTASSWNRSFTVNQ